MDIRKGFAAEKGNFCKWSFLKMKFQEISSYKYPHLINSLLPVFLRLGGITRMWYCRVLPEPYALHPLKIAK